MRLRSTFSIMLISTKKNQKCLVAILRDFLNGFFILDMISIENFCLDIEEDDFFQN